MREKNWVLIEKQTHLTVIPIEDDILKRFCFYF